MSVAGAGPLRVGVLGALGRMGQAVCRAVDSDDDLDLVVAVDPEHAGEAVGAAGLSAAGTIEALVQAGAEVAIDFTVPGAALHNALWCGSHGVHCVVGTTGFGADDLDAMRAAFTPGPANCLVAPNFAIGAVLMMRFAEMAAPWFETVEIIELHHDTKLDAPSGTALRTAQRVAAARRAAGGAAPGGLGPQGCGGGADATDVPVAGPAARGEVSAPGVHVHSVRLRGLVAHQEVLLGTTGQVLTLRHDSLERTSFMPGVLLAVKQIPHRRGFTVGLDELLGI